MSKPLTDPEIVKAIGVKTLVAHGYEDYVVQKWVTRVIPWHARPKILRIAREQNVQLPHDFDIRQRPAPKKARAAA